MNYNSPKAVSPQGEYIHIVGNVEDYLGAKYGGMRVDGCGETGGTMVDLPWVEPQPGPFLRIEYIHSVVIPKRSICARFGPNWVGGWRDMGLTSYKGKPKNSKILTDKVGDNKVESRWVRQ